MTEHMTGEAWIFMLSVWAVVILTTGYCFVRLLTSKRKLDGEGE